MAETEIERLRARIDRQRKRLTRDDEPAEPVAAEAVPSSDPHLRAGRLAGRGPGSSLGRLFTEHPGLALGLGAAVLLAGPRRSLRIARGAMRGAVLVLAAYRSASSLVGLLPPRHAAGGGAAMDRARMRRG